MCTSVRHNGCGGLDKLLRTAVMEPGISTAIATVCVMKAKKKRRNLTMYLTKI